MREKIELGAGSRAITHKWWEQHLCLCWEGREELDGCAPGHERVGVELEEDRLLGDGVL